MTKRVDESLSGEVHVQTLRMSLHYATSVLSQGAGPKHVGIFKLGAIIGRASHPRSASIGCHEVEQKEGRSERRESCRDN